MRSIGTSTALGKQDFRALPTPPATRALISRTATRCVVIRAACRRCGDIPARWPRRDLLAGRAPDALANGALFRIVANCLLRILPRKRLLSRSLSFDAFVLLPVPTNHVSLPQLQCVRLLPPNCRTPKATISSLVG